MAAVPPFERARIAMAIRKEPVIVHDDLGDIDAGTRDVHQVFVRQGSQKKLIGETAPTFIIDGMHIPNVVLYPVELAALLVFALVEKRKANKAVTVFEEGQK
jgi:hypothetical protein